MRKPGRGFVAVLLALPLFAAPLLAVAQMPPHAPGTVCVTPSFWCWASQPGEPGGACTCPSPYGPVKGQLG
ncbi:MAG: hypothetical protein RIQ60_4459 [Pseudomonadota bacterium]|jgi:hypothetical protein